MNWHTDTIRRAQDWALAYNLAHENSDRFPGSCMKYWYAPQFRPPGFGGMPDRPTKPLLERGRLFPGQRFEAWAYPVELEGEQTEQFDLKLVLVEGEK